MSKHLAVAIIHGMGSQKPGFSHPLRDELAQRVGAKAEQIAWEEIYWQDVLERRELAYLTRAQRPPNKLRWLDLRQFVLTALGDAVAYQRVASTHNRTYDLIHDRVEAAMSRLRAQLGRDDVPLVVCAHSLGCHIMSNYIWDAQCGNKCRDADGSERLRGASDFERMQTLAGFVTFGCNLPLFSFAYDKVDPIRFPGEALPYRLRSAARWLNFYDADDILAYPLKELSDSYREAVYSDTEINVGSLLKSWNPMSHGEYWTDNDFTKPVATLLSSLLDAGTE